MFGDTIYLGKIPEADWVSNICSRFNKTGITISEGHAEDICRRVECYSSYVQQRFAPLNEFCPQKVAFLRTSYSKSATCP